MPPELDSLDTRITKLESKVNEFLLKVRILTWLAGGLAACLAALGLSFPVVARYLVQKSYAKAESELHQSINRDLSQANQAEADLAKEIAQAKLTSPGVSNPKAIAAHPHSVEARTRTVRQMSGFSELLEQPIQGVYSTEHLTNDVGQLVNCVTVFIADMQAHNVSAAYDRTASDTYARLIHLSGDLQRRVQQYDDPAHDAGYEWHATGWFSQFNERLNIMEAAHRQKNTLQDEDLSRWRSNFEQVRGGLWGAAYSGPWPQPLP